MPSAELVLKPWTKTRPCCTPAGSATTSELIARMNSPLLSSLVTDETRNCVLGSTLLGLGYCTSPTARFGGIETLNVEKLVVCERVSAKNAGAGAISREVATSTVRSLIAALSSGNCASVPRGPHPDKKPTERNTARDRPQALATAVIGAGRLSKRFLRKARKHSSPQISNQPGRFARRRLQGQNLL